MLSLHLFFIVTVNTYRRHRNPGQRAVAEKFAQIALIGAAAILSLLALP